MCGICGDQVLGTSQCTLIPPGHFHKAARSFSTVTRRAANQSCFVVVPSQPCCRQNKALVSADKHNTMKLCEKAEAGVATQNLFQLIWNSENVRHPLRLFPLCYHVAMLGTVSDRRGNNRPEREKMRRHKNSLWSFIYFNKNSDRDVVGIIIDKCNTMIIIISKKKGNVNRANV